MKTIQDILARNNVTIFGKGSIPMLFLHGYGCNQNMWRFTTPAFEETYQIILVDLVGSGKSDEAAYNFEKYSSLQGYVNDVLDICEALDLKNVILVGHSVSAMIGVLACIKKSEIFRQLILIGPSPRYINDDSYIGGFTQEAINELIETLDSNYLGWSSAVAPAIMGNADRPELAEELTNSFCRNNPAIAKHFAKVTFLGDNRNDLPNLTTEALVLQCSSDIIAPIEVGQYVHDHIKKSKFVMLEATGHCPHLSAPSETIKAIQEFLAT